MIFWVKNKASTYMRGRLIHSKIQYVSQIFSQESQTTADYENMNLVRKGKATKILKKKTFSPRWKMPWSFL